jgi:WD40 repeat protein
MQVSEDCGLLACANGKEVTVFNTASGQQVGDQFTADSPVRSLAWSPDGRRLALISLRKAVLLDLVTSQPAFPSLDFAHELHGIEFSPDGQWFATCCSDAELAGREAQVWDARTSRPAGPPLRQADGVPLATFSPDSSLLATGCEDGTARLWHFLTGQAASPRLLLPSHVIGATFARSNRWIAASCIGPAGVARAWTCDGEPLTLPLVHPGAILPLQFLANGRYLLTTSDGRQRIWDLSEDHRPAKDLQALAQLLANHRLDGTGTVEPLDLPALGDAWAELNSRYPEQFKSVEQPSEFRPVLQGHKQGK